MAVKVAINGFGRIGRNILRAIVEIAAARTSRSSPSTISARSRPTPICCASTACTAASRARSRSRATRSIVGTGTIKVTAIKNPAELPHKELGVDIALECTGIFTAKDKAAAHLEAGAKRVLVSAPADGADLTVVYGVNHDKLTKDHIVVSNALVHDQLPRAGRQGAERRGRHRAAAS